MKTAIKSFILLLSFISFNAFAGGTDKTIDIKTSAVCGMCKDKIEGALAFEKGVVKSKLNIKTKVISVTYNPEKTGPDKIRKAISLVGYNADDVKADKAAYEKLDGCCKKDGCKD